MNKITRNIFLISAWLFITGVVYAQPVPVSDQQAIDNVVLALYPDNKAEVKIQYLHGGYSGDRLYRITVKDDNLVVRVNHQQKSTDTKRFEVACINNAFTLGIGPKLLYQMEDYSVIATEYVQGEPLSIEALKQEDLIKVLAKNLNKLHNGDKFERSWSVFDYIRRSTKGNVGQRYKAAQVKLNEIEQVLKKAKFPLKPAHNDIQQNNLFLVAGNKIQFIDWGDAGMSSPFWDLARVSMEFAFSPQQDKDFLMQYTGSITKLDVTRFWLMKQVFLLRTAFELYKLKGGPDPAKLNDIIKIFEANDYPLNIKDEQVTWQHVAQHALELFEKNSLTNDYKEAIRYIKEAAK